MDDAFVPLQIMPADGWSFAIKDSDGERSLIPLACWTLAELPSGDDSPGMRQILGYHPGHGYVEFAEGFDGYVHDSEAKPKPRARAKKK